MRVNKIKNLLPLKILNAENVQPDRLSDHIVQMLDQKRTLKTLPIDLDGAANAANFLSRWLSERVD